MLPSGIDCGPLNNIDNGRVEFSSTNVGSIANYFCKNGFSLVGEGQRRCQQSGQWSGVEPTCKSQLDAIPLRCYPFISFWVSC